MALGDTQTAPDGRILYDFGYINGPLQKVVRGELPAAVTRLRKLHPEFLIVLAGNAGAEYQDTRHNLGQQFGRYLREHVPAVGSVAGLEGREAAPFAVQDTVEISYDDSTTRSWTTTFRTEAPAFRTRSGEIFYLPDLGGRRVILAQTLGDYNEVGDFAIPLLEKLGLTPDRLILIHDEADLQPGEVQFASGKPVAYAGNNAVFSLIRNLAYRANRQVLEVLSAHALFQQVADRAALGRLAAELRERGEIRYANHLGIEGSADPFSYAFKNRNAILNPILKFLREAKKEKLASETQSIRAALGEALNEITRREKTFTATLSGGRPTPEQQATLRALKEDRNQVLAPVRARETALEAEFTALMAEIEKIVDRELTYSRLALGIGRPEDGDMISHVLGPAPAELLKSDLMAQALAWLQEAFHRVGAP